MKTKIIGVMCAISLVTAAMPKTFGANSDYVGSYYAYDTSGSAYTTLDILTCDDTSITIDFARDKENSTKFTYVCYEGTMDGTTGTVPFDAQTESGGVLSGTITIDLAASGTVGIKVISSQGQTFFEGTMAKDETADNSNDTDTDTVTEPEESTPAPTEAPLGNPNVTLNLNGEELTFDSDVTPVIIDNFTYVPLRTVFTQMGINVYWDEYEKNSLYREQLITCTKNETVLQFARTLNDDGANAWTLRRWEQSSTDEAETSEINIADLQPKLIVTSSYIPLRIVSEAFGANVEWDDETKTVLITCDTDNAYYNTPEEIAATEDYTVDAAREYITQDYSSVVPNDTPYFSPEGKFYTFDAQDQWNNVKLKIFYGGYITVVPVQTEEEPAETAAPTETASETPTETPTEVPTEETATEEPTQTEIPEETEAPTEEPTASPEPEASAEPTETPAASSAN